MRVRATSREDFEQIKNIVVAADAFNNDEVDIAIELLEIYLNDPQQQDYKMYSCVSDVEKVLGYICIGPTPATEATYDLYWIVVDPAVQAQGVGTTLLSFTENELKSKNGRLLIAETSSTPKYDKTRAFYERKGFKKLAHIKEYYKTDDDLVIYGKYL